MKSGTNVIEIIDAVYLNGYRIKVVFNDGSDRIIDFEEFLRNAGNPMTKQYLRKDKFKGFKIKYGDLMWGDYEMCFPIWDLYEGHI